MTDLRKAAEQALEALESVYGKGKRCEAAIKALRQALAQPVDPVKMSQERVDETAKDRLVRIMGTFDLATGHADTMEQALDALEDELRDVLGHLRVRHEWVGLTDADIAKAMHGNVEGSNMLPYQFARAIEQALKEKDYGSSNT